MPVIKCRNNTQGRNSCLCSLYWKNKLIKNQKRDLNYLKTGQLSSVHNIVDYMPKYKKFGSNSKLYEIFNAIFGPHQKQWFNSSYFFKPKKVGIETKPHQDNAYFNLNPCDAFTAWIPTDSVTKKNSAFYHIHKPYYSNVSGTI